MSHRMQGISITPGEILDADHYVFALGPWLGKVFPFLRPRSLRLHWRGFKIADDTRGLVIDPSTLEREISEDRLTAARAYLRMRFPAMACSPLL